MVTLGVTVWIRLWHSVIDLVILVMEEPISAEAYAKWDMVATTRDIQGRKCRPAVVSMIVTLGVMLKYDSSYWSRMWSQDQVQSEETK
jgi:hypothetical protein